MARLDELTELALGHLEEYRIVETRRGREARARCPFHDDRSPSFGLNLDTGAWNCFAGCGGGWVDTLLLRFGYPAARVRELTQGLRKSSKPTAAERWRKILAERAETPHLLPDEVLDSFPRCPVKLLDDGWPEALLYEFQVGFDARESRIVFPIRDAEGNLQALSGRTVYDFVEPKYLLYPEDYLLEHAPEGYEPPRDRLLFNIQRAYTSGLEEVVVIAEGFKEVMRLHQFGYKGVATLGTHFSRNQIRLLNRLYHRTMCRFVVVFDNDDAGYAQAPKLCQALSRFCRPHIAFTEEAKDLGDLTEKTAIEATLGRAEPYIIWETQQRRERIHDIGT